MPPRVNRVGIGFGQICDGTAGQMICPWDRAAPRRFTYPLENLDSQAQNQINHFHTRRLDRLHPLDTDDVR
jgi:hypothetical protein